VLPVRWVVVLTYKYSSKRNQTGSNTGAGLRIPSVLAELPDGRICLRRVTVIRLHDSRSTEEQSSYNLMHLTL